MRTEADLIDALRNPNRNDLFGFGSEVYLCYLSADAVKEFAKKDADLTGWPLTPLTEEAVIADMRTYMEFAWEKALGHRGLSAGRSIEKMMAWLWILGDDAFCEEVENCSYRNYGVPKLVLICKKFGFPIPDRQSVDRMAAGQPCHPGCEDGCGR